jgi:hypothetical protein
MSTKFGEIKALGSKLALAQGFIDFLYMFYVLIEKSSFKKTITLELRY